MNFLQLSLRTKTVFIVTGIFIGMLVSTQFRSAIPTGSYLYDQLAIQKELVKSFIDDQALLKSKIVSLRKKIEENQEKTRTASQVNNLETLRELKKEIGLETAKGQGITINLNDGVFVNRENMENIDQSLVHASDLRDMVNLLRTAQVEAIAINDQRVIASTPITSVGNTILVNNFHLLPPFNITAVGDPELIMQRLKDPTVLPDLQKRVKELKVQYAVEANNNLIIPVYNGNLTLKYIQQATAQNS